MISGVRKMADLEKVIKGLEYCISPGDDCPDDCPYAGNCNRDELHKDALELLKEREPVKPLREHSGSGITWWNVCAACKTAINPNDKFCHECGRAVKWDG